LNDTSIEIGAFTNAKRPLIIDLSSNKFTYLDEKIIAPILHVDDRNIININGNALACDCRMSWLKVDKNLELSRRIQGIQCSNGNNFYTLSEKYFDSCKL